MALSSIWLSKMRGMQSQSDVYDRPVKAILFWLKDHDVERGPQTLKAALEGVL